MPGVRRLAAFLASATGWPTSPAAPFSPSSSTKTVPHPTTLLYHRGNVVRRFAASTVSHGYPSCRWRLEAASRAPPLPTAAASFVVSGAPPTQPPVWLRSTPMQRGLGFEHIKMKKLTSKAKERNPQMNSRLLLCR